MTCEGQGRVYTHPCGHIALTNKCVYAYVCMYHSDLKSRIHLPDGINWIIQAYAHPLKDCWQQALGALQAALAYFGNAHGQGACDVSLLLDLDLNAHALVRPSLQRLEFHFLCYLNFQPGVVPVCMSINSNLEAAQLSNTKM